MLNFCKRNVITLPSPWHHHFRTESSQETKTYLIINIFVESCGDMMLTYFYSVVI